MDGICYILSGNLYLCPYLKSLYLKNASHDHDSIIYWDREGLDEDSLGLHPYRFSYYLNDSSSAMKLLQGYLSFRRFVNRTIREYHFSRIVLLNTIAGYCAYPTIVGRYSGKYILDVRDYGGERFVPLGIVSRQLAKKAGLTLLSSKYYHEFLGNRFQCQYVHNIQEAPDDIVSSCRRRLLGSRNRRITIAYIGTVKPYLENHKHLIDCLGGDCRFKLKFIGSGSDELVQYCEERSVDNVEVHGRFEPEEMFGLYHDVDMIHNLYGNHTPFLDYALSNKLYIAAQLGLPILVCPDTAIEAESHRYGIGFTVDLHASSSNEVDLGDTLWNYYQNIEARQFLDGCNRLLDNARVQDEKTVASIKQFLASEQ